MGDQSIKENTVNIKKYADRLIGCAVQNMQSLEKGIITAAEDGKVKVDYGDGISTYVFPSCFANSLLLENDKLQSELSGESYDKDFDTFKIQYASAVAKEVAYLQSSVAKRNRAIDGERLKNQNGQYVYAFDTDSELHYPDGTEMKLWLGERVIKAHVVSCEEFTVIIRCDEYLGDKVDTVEYTVDSWYLLRILQDRIEGLDFESNPIAYKVARQGDKKIKHAISGIAKGQELALTRSTDDPILFIWGPPGTGKTETLANIALEHMQRGERVLMVSYSNVSVDEALLRVAGRSDYPDGTIVRFGYPRRDELIDNDKLTSYQIVLKRFPELREEYSNLVAEKKKLGSKEQRAADISKRVAEIRLELQDKEKSLVQDALFVATTITKATVDRAIYGQSFDVVIFDEASMAYIPQVVFAASLAKQNFVCMGDFRQLPAIVQNPQNRMLSQDIFEYTGITDAVDGGYRHDWMVMLNVQHRMHPSIADFVSDNMYGSLLLSAEDLLEQREEISANEPIADSPMALLDLSGMYSVCSSTMDGSRYNILSAFVSLKTAELYLDKYEVGIITPYRAQAQLITAMLRDLRKKDDRYKSITCATVHQYQGSEKPVIIFDVVDCFRAPYIGVLLTKTENNQADRLFNVALTRAQGKVIIVANCDYLKIKKLSKNLLIYKALDMIKKHDDAYTGDKLLSYLIDTVEEGSQVEFMDTSDAFPRFIEDIRSATSKVSIFIPGMIDDDEESLDLLRKAIKDAEKKGVKIEVRKDGEVWLPECLKGRLKKDGDYVAVPVTIMDSSTIWYGEPLCVADFISSGDPIPTEYSICARFKGYFTARSLLASI